MVAEKDNHGVLVRLRKIFRQLLHRLVRDLHQGQIVVQRLGFAVGNLDIWMEIVKVIRVGGVVLHCHIEHKKRRVRRLRLIHANDFVITGFVTYIFSDSFRFL